MIGFAQCPAGQTEVFIDVLTDGYVKEIYWELAPTSSNCGSSVIHFS